MVDFLLLFPHFAHGARRTNDLASSLSSPLGSAVQMTTPTASPYIWAI
jgi:hypothetical protein